MNTTKRFNKGQSETRLYGIWSSMKSRCYLKTNPLYKNYGQRGIKVCDRWLEKQNGYENFCLDMGIRPSLKHSIDRINVDGNYCPENCKWATYKEQANNKRNNRYYFYQDKKYTLTQLAIKFNLKHRTLQNRLDLGWNLEDALTKEVGLFSRGKYMPIKQINKKTNEIMETFYSIKQAAEITGDNPRSISSALSRKGTTKLFKWIKIENEQET